MAQEKTGRLIVVDDEIETLTPLCDLLFEWGYEVARFTSGKEALEVFAKQQFDVLLTDLVMPGMDGIAVIREAGKIDPLLVSIIITGHGTIQTAVDAMKNGAFDYVLKPIEWKLFKPVIARAMETRRLRESEKQYRSIVEVQTELICRSKPGAIITFVNEAYCRYFSKKPEELIGRSFMSLIPEEDHERIREHFALLTPENQVSTLEHRVLCPDGEQCWQQWTNMAIFDEDGNITEYQSIGRDITDRKQMGKLLRESEERYRLHFENTSDVIYSLDNEFRILSISPSVENILGYTPEELTGRKFQDLNILAPQSLEAAFTDALHVLSGESISASVYEFITKDGGKRFGEVSGSPLIRDGKVVAVVSVARDITERMRAEEVLKDSENRLKSIFRTAPVGTGVVSSPDRIIKDVNDQICIMLGYYESELLGKSERILYPSHTDFQRVMIEMDKQINEYGVGTIETQWKRQDGRIIDVILRSSPIDREDLSRGITFTAMDITERKNAETELRESEERLRSLANAAFEGIAFHDKGVLLRANEQFFNMFGYEPEELLRKQIIPIIIAPEGRAFFKRQISENKKVPYESIGMKKDGTKFPMHIRARDAELEGNKIRIETIMDITERKRFEERLEMSYRLLKELSSRISEVEEAERKRLARELHDQVGQNLTALSISLNTLPKLVSHEEAGKIKDHVETTHKLLEETAQSIRNVMTDLRPSVLDDYGLVAALRWYAQRFSQRTGIPVKITGKNLESRLPGFSEITLYRIAQEALTNVSKHAGAKTATIRVRETKRGMKLSIADDGKGFNPATIDRMKRQTVWGLLTMKERAEAMGGNMEVKSSPGKGTKITVEIKR